MVPFFGRLFSWKDFIPSQFSTVLFHWWAFMLLHAFNNLHVCLVVIHVWFLTCWLRALWMLRWLTCRLLQAFCTWKDNFIWSMFDVWPSGCYLRMFCMRQVVVCIRLVRNGLFLPMFVPNSQINVYFGLFVICLHLICVSAGLTSWITSKFYSYVNLEVFIYVS